MDRKEDAAVRLSFLQRVRRDMTRNWTAYVLAVPVLAYYILFHYKPMYGIVIAFKKFSIRKGIMGSPWVGFQYFQDFFSSYYFWRLLRNTLTISLSSLVFAFPVPIIFALLLNEVRVPWYKKTIQTISYMPHFISLVIICSMVRDFCSTNGLFNTILAAFGIARIDFLIQPKWFYPIYIISGILQHIGWDSIIYLAALGGIDPELYEAATVDGANRLRRAWHVTLPGIMPTITILLILRIGSLMSVGYEKIILLYNPSVYETADTISTFVYRRGLVDGKYSFASAVGLMNSVVNFILVIAVNTISKRVSEVSLW